MIKLSTKTRYAMRTMVELAVRAGTTPTQLKEIADEHGISEKYLEQIATLLRIAGLVRSERGSNGGYRLALPAEEISALDVVQATEGGALLVDCLTDSTTCPRWEICVTRGVWNSVSDSIRTTLSGITLAALAEQQRRQGRAAGSDLYEI